MVAQQAPVLSFAYLDASCSFPLEQYLAPLTSPQNTSLSVHCDSAHPIGLLLPAFVCHLERMLAELE